jgi:hypothetical protein
LNEASATLFSTDIFMKKYLQPLDMRDAKNYFNDFEPMRPSAWKNLVAAYKIETKSRGSML